MISKVKKPNIILLVLDTVRMDHLSCYGYEKRTTPTLDKIADNATVYQNCYSPSCWTLPSHASIFTGTYLSRHNVGDAGDVLDGQFITIAEFLKQQNYNTLGVCYIPWVSKITGLDRGFDCFLTKFNRNILFRVGKKIVDQTKKQQRFQREANADVNKLRDTRWIEATTRSRFHWFKTLFSDDGAAFSQKTVMQWISEKKEHPFFAFINYCEPHTIYHPPLGFRRKFLNNKSRPFWRINQDHREVMYNNLLMTDEDFEILKALYDGEISYVDWRIKYFIKFLKKQKIWDNTLLIVTSDHGEQFGEKKFMGHARNLYNSLIKVPLIVKYPKGTEAPRLKNQFVQTVDLFPTIIDLLGESRNSINNQIQGNSLISDSISKRDKHFIVSEYKMQPFSGDCFQSYPQAILEKYLYASRALIFDNYKYIWKSNGHEEMYQILLDVEENTNLINQEIEKADLLREKLSSWLNSFEAHYLTDSKKEDFQVDDTVKDRLKALGYW
ncbi:MAG TPA: hypothetical protein ENN22_13700 [bacterium]|nr:hypothetical protein [bacterium]